MPEDEKKFLEDLTKQWIEMWPAPIVCQKEIERFTGGLLKRQTFSNLNAQGKGPVGKFYVRGQACWKTVGIVPWLLETLTMDKRKKPCVR